MEVTSINRQIGMGVIPDSWKLKILDEVSAITRLAGYEYSTLWKETLNGEIIALRGFNIGKNKIIEKDFVRISDSLSKRLIRSRLFKNDVIYPCVGTIGNAVVIEEDDKYHIQQNIAKITPKKNILNSTFLAYYLMSDLGLKEIDKFNGSSSQPNILVGSLRKYTIPIPTLEEQTAIATVLSDTDALISSLEKLIAKKRNIKQGTMQELLKPKKGWEVRRLGEVCKIFGRIGFRGYTVADIVKEGQGAISISPSNIQGDRTNFEKCTYISWFKYEESPEIKINNGDILLVKTGSTFGKTAIVKNLKEKATVNPQIVVLKDILINNSFLAYLMNFKTVQDQIITTVVGGAIPTLSQQQIASFKISIPKTREEQNQIAEILGSCDDEISALEFKLSKYRQIKSGMMQSLLTGKIRLI